MCVLSCDNLPNLTHATITDFNCTCVSIENLIDVTCWEACVYKFEKTAYNVCPEDLTEWRVKPNDMRCLFPRSSCVFCGQ